MTYKAVKLFSHPLLGQIDPGTLISTKAVNLFADTPSLFLRVLRGHDISTLQTLRADVLQLITDHCEEASEVLFMEAVMAAQAKNGCRNCERL